MTEREALQKIAELIEDNRATYPEDPPRFKECGIATYETEIIADILKEVLGSVH